MNEYEKQLNSYCSRICSQFASNEKLCNQFIEIKDVACMIAQDAHLYDFPGVKCNGFRFALKTTLLLMQHVLQNYDTKADKELIHLVTIIHCGSRHFKQMLDETSKLPLNANGSRSLLLPDYRLIAESLETFLAANGMDVLFNSLCGFQLPKPSGAVCRLFFGFLVPMAHSPDLWTGLKTLFDYRSRRTRCREVFTNFKIDYVKAVDFFCDNFFTRSITPLIQVSIFYPSVCRDIHVPRQSQFKISVDVKSGHASLLQLTRGRNFSSTTVRCRLLMSTSMFGRNLPRERPVVIHVHGGGFVIGSPDNHEMYTRAWVRNLPPGTAFVSVDYSLGPEVVFPGQLQQILGKFSLHHSHHLMPLSFSDVYLWCHDECCVETLGYKPNKFILIGDSSGGINLLALSVVLSDLQKKYPTIPVIYPSGLVAIYPSFCVAPVALPSMLLASIHPELSPPAFFAMQTAYIPYEDNAREIKYKKLSPSSILKWLSPWSAKYLLGLTDTDDDVTNNNNDHIWWNKSVDVTMARLNTWPLISHPYASPLFYDDFASLGRMELSLFVVESDPILDHAICLANKWQGKVSLRVIDDAVHAFLPFADAGLLDSKNTFSKHRDAMSRELNRLIES